MSGPFRETFRPESPTSFLWPARTAPRVWGVDLLGPEDSLCWALNRLGLPSFWTTMAGLHGWPQQKVTRLCQSWCSRTSFLNSSFHFTCSYSESLCHFSVRRLKLIPRLGSCFEDQFLTRVSDPDAVGSEGTGIGQPHGWTWAREEVSLEWHVQGGAGLTRQGGGT